MKIYCILLDSFPYNETVLNKFANVFDLKLARQITNCFTTTSCISAFTGKLPSDLISGGIGYKSYEKFKRNGKINWPFENDIVFEKLRENKFEFYSHNARFYNNIISNNSIRSTGFVGGIEVEDKKSWGGHNVPNMLLDSLEYKKNERNFIKTVNENLKDSAYFIIYHHCHVCCTHKRQQLPFMNESLKLLSNFDFNEPDTFFWIFSDHGDFNHITQHIKPKDYHMWVMYKNNTSKRLELPSLISISDFYSIIKELFVEDKGEFIIKEYLNRVYYVEDSRMQINPHGSTSFVSCLEKNNEIHQALKILGNDKVFYNKNDKQVNNILRTKLYKKFGLS